MSIAGMVVLSQIGTTIYHESLNKFDWTWFEHKPLANYVLENYPEFYNPDPHIFFVRTTGKDVLDTSYGPVIFRDKYENIKKIMVHTHSEKKLNALGVDTNNLFVGNSTRDKINGWYYLNAEEIPVLEFDVFQKTLKESSVESTKIRIRSTPEWMEQIKIKASEKNISVDSMITLDAIYILNQEQ
jgi:hypothetical protein